MPPFFQMLVVLIVNALALRRDAQVRFLKLQLELLRKKVPGNRIILDPDDRTRLLKMGEELEHGVKDSLVLISFKTYQQWLRDQRVGKQPKKVGRPKLAQQLINLVLRLAKENVHWGLKRIVGELKKLGETVGRSTVQRILTEEGMYPDPNRKGRMIPDTPWQNFLKLHMNTIVACDFLAKTIWTPLGKKTAYLLMFVHLETRKVFLSPATYSPNEEWVCQQARNVTMWLEQNGVAQRFILHDRDTKFSAAFDAIFEAAGVQIVKTPVAAPNANAFAETWIGKCKFESLDHFVCFSLAHLDHIAQAYVEYHNELRPHQSKGNEPLRFEGQAPPATAGKGPVQCREILGGLLRHYYRRAA